jgi:hypothetical protein
MAPSMAPSIAPSMALYGHKGIKGPFYGPCMALLYGKHEQCAWGHTYINI